MKNDPARTVSQTLHELTPDSYPALQALFAPALRHLPLLGALEDRHPARVFADDGAHPTVALVAAQWGYFYLAGSPGRPAADAVSERISRELLPWLLARGQAGFVFWPLSGGWDAWLNTLLPGRRLLRASRRTFAFDPATFYENRFSRPQLPGGLALRPIDAALLDTMLDDLSAEISATWRSPADFLQAGFGVCLMDGRALASACFSAFVAGDAAEVSVLTAPAYRRRGYATLSAAAFVAECLRRRLRPSWECFGDNLPSLKLAENLGFKAQADLPVYYWEEN